MGNPCLEEALMANSNHEKKADRMTLQSLREVEEGLSAPIDDLLLMIDEDKNASVGRGRDELHSGKAKSPFSWTG